MSHENEQDILTTSSSNICVTNIRTDVLKYFDRDALGLRCITVLVCGGILNIASGKRQESGVKCVIRHKLFY